MTYDYQTALKHAFRAVEQIKTSTQLIAGESKPKSKAELSTTPTCRQLYLVELTPSEVLSYCIEIMVSCLKSTILLSLKPSDIGLGHLIVLSQYRWPKYVDLFMQCVSAIQLPLKPLPVGKASAQAAVHKFTYLEFFDYVFNPDILEEFMALAADERLVLDLSAISNQTIKPMTTKSMTTRGVNKGAKEEVRVALVSQMRNSKSLVDNTLLIDFILNYMKQTMSSYT